MLTLLASVSGKMHSSNYFQSDTKVHLEDLEKKIGTDCQIPSVHLQTIFGAKIQIDMHIWKCDFLR